MSPHRKKKVTRKVERVTKEKVIKVTLKEEKGKTESVIIEGSQDTFPKIAGRKEAAKQKEKGLTKLELRSK